MSKRSTLIVLAGLGIGAVWYLTKDQKPLYDSLGNPIDYTHPISWIKPSTDATVIAEARKSWQLEEKIRKQNMGSNYIEKPFDISDYYGGAYQSPPKSNPVVHIPVADPGIRGIEHNNPFAIPIFAINKARFNLLG
jgi:hypothetical protein